MYWVWKVAELADIGPDQPRKKIGFGFTILETGFRG